MLPALRESNGERYLEHMGGGPGFATTMRLYPDLGLGIVILANGTDLADLCPSGRRI